VENSGWKEIGEKNRLCRAAAQSERKKGVFLKADLGL